MNEIGLLPIFLIRSQDKKYMRLTLQLPKKAGNYELRRSSGIFSNITSHTS